MSVDGDVREARVCVCVCVCVCVSGRNLVWSSNSRVCVCVCVSQNGLQDKKYIYILVARREKRKKEREIEDAWSQWRRSSGPFLAVFLRGGVPA